MSQKAIFDHDSGQRSQEAIGNFYALDILKDHLSGEVWFTENSDCIRVKNESEIFYDGDGSIHMKWDKQEGGCDWIGMGIGWDGWSGKNISGILRKGAIQIKVKSPAGPVKSLPLAASLEDYGGKAAWIGFAPEYISHMPSEEWSTVTLPLSKFGWNEFGADPGNVKQFIIQFEAAGEVYMDEIRLIPYDGIGEKKYSTTISRDAGITVDGDLGDWKNVSELKMEGGTVKIISGTDALFIGGFINDPTFGQKTDGIEILFSTNHRAEPARKKPLLSDRHFVLTPSDGGSVTDRRWNNRSVSGAKVMTKNSTGGYTFEMSIPLEYLDLSSFVKDHPYFLEIALNREGQDQSRWNSRGLVGYENNVSHWGNIVFE